MKLYEIAEELAALVDPETGEVLDIEAFDALMIAKDEKLESVALWVKNLRSDAEQIKAEEAILARRRKSAENKATRLANYLSVWLMGRPFETPRVKCSWRKRSSVEIPDNRPFVEWALANNRTALLNFSDPTPNKTAVKEFINNGGEPVGALINSDPSLLIQ